jgi:hypothetical protein
VPEPQDSDRINLSEFWRMQESVRQIERRVNENDRRMERIETKLEQIAAISVQMLSLDASLKALSQKFDDAADQGSTSRRSDWGLAVQITSFGVMAIIAVASLIIALLKSGVH